MWYILYDEILSDRQRGERNAWGGLFSLIGLSRRIWDETDARSDGISRSFVHKNSSFVRFVSNFLYDLFCIHFLRVQSCVTVTLVVDFWHLCLPQFYGIAKKLYIPANCLSPIVEFCEQSNLTPLTRTQVHRIHTTGCKLAYILLPLLFFY